MHRKILVPFSISLLFFSATLTAQQSKPLSKKAYLQILNGLWVREEYRNVLLETLSPLKTFTQTPGTVSLIIDTKGLKGNTLTVQENINNHEGDEFKIYLTPTLSSFKTSRAGEKVDLKPAGTEPVLIFEKTRFKKITGDLRYAGLNGGEYIINKTMLAGTYLLRSKYGEDSSIVVLNDNGTMTGLNANGTMTGYNEFTSYSAKNEFAGGAGNRDAIKLINDRKISKEFDFFLDPETLHIYDQATGQALYSLDKRPNGTTIPFSNVTKTFVVADTSNNQSKKYYKSDAGQVILFSFPSGVGLRKWIRTPVAGNVVNFMNENHHRGDRVNPDGNQMLGGMFDRLNYFYTLSGNPGQTKLTFNFVSPRDTGTIIKSMDYTIEVVDEVGPFLVTDDYNHGAHIFSSTDAGRTVIINLVENTSTGSTWSMPDPLSQNVLLLKSDESIGGQKIVNGVPYVGVSGTKQYSFTLTGKPGTVKLSFIYSRPWEKIAPPSKTFDYTITVR